MRIFKTSLGHIVIQGLLLAALAVFTLRPENLDGSTRLLVLVIADVIMAAFFISSFFRRVVLDGDFLKVNSLWRKSEVNIRHIEYAQSLSAFGRLVMILNDGSRTVIVSSLINGLDKIAEVVKPFLPESERGKLDAITPSATASKKRVYNSVMIMLLLIVCYGIARSFLNLPEPALAGFAVL